MTKKLETLIPDIMSLLKEGKEVSPADLEEFGRKVAATVGESLKRRSSSGGLRMSSLGDCDRRQWYKNNAEGMGYIPPEEMSGQTFMKFMYGHVVEEVVLFLAEQAGHKVEGTQHEVEINGVKGHIDCIIDDELVDVKTSSGFGFMKFSKGEQLYEDDPFNYMAQMSGYAEALDKDVGHFLVVNKENGNMCLDTYDALRSDTSERIDHLREVMDGDEPPTHPEEFTSVPDGKSGNMKLCTKCSYCEWKSECYKESNDGVGLRKFVYSNAPRFLTAVDRTPKVEEVK